MRLINSVIIIHVYILIFILSFSIFVYIYIDSLNLLERSDDKKMNANPKNWSNVTGALTDFEIQTRTEKLNIYTCNSFETESNEIIVFMPNCVGYACDK